MYLKSNIAQNYFKSLWSHLLRKLDLLVRIDEEKKFGFDKKIGKNLSAQYKLDLKKKEEKRFEDTKTNEFSNERLVENERRAMVERQKLKERLEKRRKREMFKSKIRDDPNVEYNDSKKICIKFDSSEAEMNNMDDLNFSISNTREEHRDFNSDDKNFEKRRQLLNEEENSSTESLTE